jgi:hypothetical protein
MVKANGTCSLRAKATAANVKSVVILAICWTMTALDSICSARLRRMRHYALLDYKHG